MILYALALLTATPATLPAQLAAAKPGDTIKLSPGDYGAVRIVKRNFCSDAKCSKRLTINAGGARMSVLVQDSRGVLFRGGTYKALPNSLGYAVQWNRAQYVDIVQAVFLESKRGIVIGSTFDFSVKQSRFSRMTIDGVNIAGSERGVISGNRCEGFNIGKDHPDCIQGWSRPGLIVRDIQVVHNIIEPHTQGIFFGNHVRNGVDDGGFDRITISHNKVHTSAPQGIGLYDCRTCTVSFNTVTTVPGSKHRSSINVVRGTVKQEGNTVGPKS